jgi:hypothetical protein
MALGFKINMTKVTKTINPLHFEDLEPHRFEDLYRQLVYDFREWSNLEATGTTGSDDGFDARGRESILDVENTYEEDDGKPSETEERIWLIQCKREKSISPQKMAKYLQDIFTVNSEPLYGIIFIAACNFSKRSRDTFISEIRKNGIKEFQLWGKSELEDLLFQPKNDHLLFAYFGVSLEIRKRTIKTKLRSRIATKKKALRALDQLGMQYVLVRDATDVHYPYSGEVPNFDKLPPWKIYFYEEQKHNGLEFMVKKYLAYLSDDKIHFDYIEEFNAHQNWNDPWRSEEKDGESIEKKWRELPEQNMAYIEIYRVINYDNIIAIDEDGDNIFRGPHFYANYSPKDGPFEPYASAKLTNCVIGEGRVVIENPDLKCRIEYFAKKMNKSK